MKRNITTLFLFVFLSYNLSATDDYIMVEEVYTQLKNAIGDKERTFPVIEIRPGARRVLAYSRQKNIIFVDEQALEICRSFGSQQKDAFAFLLAHEITHFYQEHSWQESGFATSFLMDRDHYEEHVADEKEADLFGAFITHLAGYRSIKVIPSLFDRIYEAYGLQEQISNYPSLSQRKAAASEVCGKVKDLIQIFETANYLMLLGEYTSAVSAYEYILKFVKYKELYNNVGVSLFAAAALQNSYYELAYRYPIELDLDLPLREGVNADQQELLDQSIQYLTIASTLDNRHYPTYINLACAYTLNKQYLRATTLINQFQSYTTNDKQIAEIVILQGIIEAQQNNNNTATQHFEKAKQLSTDTGIQEMARYNQQLVNGASANTSSSPSQTNIVIEGIDLTFQNDFPFNTINISDNFSYEENFFSFYKVSPHTTLSHIETNSKMIAILATTNRQQTTPQNIGVGATFQQLQNTYPINNSRMINHSQGYFLFLPAQRLFFSLNNRDIVTNWGTFGVY